MELECTELGRRVLKERERCLLSSEGVEITTATVLRLGNELKQSNIYETECSKFC